MIVDGSGTNRFELDVKKKSQDMTPEVWGSELQGMTVLGLRFINAGEALFVNKTTTNKIQKKERENKTKKRIYFVRSHWKWETFKRERKRQEKRKLWGIKTATLRAIDDFGRAMSIEVMRLEASKHNWKMNFKILSNLKYLQTYGNRWKCKKGKG